MRRFFTIAGLLLGSQLLIGQTLTISPASGTYTTNSTQDFTFSIEGIPASDLLCQGTWMIEATTTGNYGDFNGQTLTTTILIAGPDLEVSLPLTFDTPPSGTLTINATATPPVSCLSYAELVAEEVNLTPAPVSSAANCDAAFLEDFESIAPGTGFSNAESSPIAVGQGLAYRQAADFSGSANRYFRVQTQGGSNERLQARNVDSEVYWESYDIPISPCCFKDFTVVVYGSGDATDYVDVYYVLNGGTPSLLQSNTGAFGTGTVTFSSCDLGPITMNSNLRIQINWSFPSERDGILRIFDLQGRLLNNRTIAGGSGRYHLPVNDLPAGMYLLQMEQNG